jgi:tetratricopeptide (TPR) repeat protein
MTFTIYRACLSISEQNQPEQAVKAFTIAAHLAPHEGRYHLGLGGALLATGKREQALKIALRGIKELSPAADFHMLAAACLFQDQPTLARTHLTSCLALDPRHPMCRSLYQRMLESHH